MIVMTLMTYKEQEQSTHYQSDQPLSTIVLKKNFN